MGGERPSSSALFLLSFDCLNLYKDLSQLLGSFRSLGIRSDSWRRVRSNLSCGTAVCMKCGNCSVKSSWTREHCSDLLKYLASLCCLKSTTFWRIQWLFNLFLVFRGKCTNWRLLLCRSLVKILTSRHMTSVQRGTTEVAVWGKGPCISLGFLANAALSHGIASEIPRLCCEHLWGESILVSRRTKWEKANLKIL